MRARRPQRLQPRAGPAPRAARGAGRRSAASTRGTASTQQAFGRFFVDLAHARSRGRRARRDGEPRRRLLDQPRRLDQPRGQSGTWASGSTGSPTTPTRWCAGASPSTASTSSSASPRATSSGCSASWARPGRATASRCCRSARSMTRSSTARSSRGRSGSTRAASRSSSARPSGVTLAPEGGAHQSIITPSVGLEQPRCVAWEPAFGQDLEWTLLHALGAARPPGRRARRTSGSAPGRSTRRSPRCRTSPAARERRRRQVLAGGYRLRVAAALPARDARRRRRR